MNNKSKRKNFPVHKIFHIGENDTHDDNGVFISKIVKFLALIVLGASVCSIVFLKYLDLDISPFPYIVLFFTLFVLVLNKYKYSQLAKFLLFLGVPTIQFIDLIIHNDAIHGAELGMLPFLLGSAMMFSTERGRLLSMIYVASLFIVVLYLKDYNLHTLFYVSIGYALVGVFIAAFILTRFINSTTSAFTRKNNILTEQNEKLEELVAQNDLKTHLLATLSHDLKGPALSFKSLSKNLSYLIKKDDFEEVAKLGAYYDEVGDKLFKDINRLLDWAISQKKSITIHPEEINLKEQLATLTDQFALQYSCKNLTYNINVEAGSKLKTDRMILEIVLNNIISNAFKYSDDGKVVDITYSNDNKTISVSNFGVEISEEVITSASKTGFYRKSKIGHGLGLGISLSLMKLLGGKLVFNNMVSNKTIVEIVLP